MAKIVIRIAKLQLKGGSAKPGAELASLGINMMSFCKEFNAKTSKDQKGEVVPIVMTIYNDKSFTFILKKMPVTNLIFKYANIKKGSDMPNKNKIGTISEEIIKKIAEYKMEDFNTVKIESAIKIVSGTAKSLGLEIESEATIAANNKKKQEQADENDEESIQNTKEEQKEIK